MTAEEVRLAGLIFLFGYPSLVLGRWCQDWCNTELGVASWRTWNFLGNAGRGPMYPWTEMPYHEDFEDVVHYRRHRQALVHETWCSYRNKQYHGHIHPQREHSDYGVISDAEHLQDIGKLLDE